MLAPAREIRSPPRFILQGVFQKLGHKGCLTGDEVHAGRSLCRWLRLGPMMKHPRIMVKNLPAWLRNGLCGDSSSRDVVPLLCAAGLRHTHEYAGPSAYTGNGEGGQGTGRIKGRKSRAPERRVNVRACASNMVTNQSEYVV